MVDIATFSQFVEKVGAPLALLFLVLAFVFNKGAKKLDEITKLLHIISVNVGRTLLSSEQSIQIFKWCLSDHIQRKIEFARERLVLNHIKDRGDQIRLALRNEFYRITQEEAQHLSQYNTPVGDMGKLLMGIDFDKFMDEVYMVFFSDSEIDRKCNDLKSLMGGYVNELVREMQIKISKNQF